MNYDIAKAALLTLQLLPDWELLINDLATEQIIALAEALNEWGINLQSEMDLLQDILAWNFDEYQKRHHPIPHCVNFLPRPERISYPE